VLKNPSVDRNSISGSEIRHNRLRLGWSRDQLARQLGVDAETIGAWETDAAAISCPLSLEQIFRQHGVTLRAPLKRLPQTVPFPQDRRTARR
jgi:transcriptional regulator with XRE-family HTH domain